MSFKYCVNMRLKVEKEKLDPCCHKKEEKKIWVLYSTKFA